MGVNTWAAFAGSDDNAMIDGDFAPAKDSRQEVLKSLCSSGINIVAIHSHRSGGALRILFLYDWSRGAAVTPAPSVKTALAPEKTK